MLKHYETDALLDSTLAGRDVASAVPRCYAIQLLRCKFVGRICL